MTNQLVYILTAEEVSIIRTADTSTVRWMPSMYFNEDDEEIGYGYPSSMLESFIYTEHNELFETLPQREPISVIVLE